MPCPPTTGRICSIAWKCGYETQLIFTVFVESTEYNARGQQTLVTYANGTRTRYEYDRDTYRLKRLYTLRRGDGLLQDLNYTYDPAGNITEIEDAAQQTAFFGGVVVEPTNRYRYDALYQLTRAEGREHPGQQPTQQDVQRSSIPHPNDSKALRRYVERYSYDASGNLEKMAHDAGTTSWTRYYAYESDASCNPVSNRLLCTSVTGDAIPQRNPHCASETNRPYSARHRHDAHGKHDPYAPSHQYGMGTTQTDSSPSTAAGEARLSIATTRAGTGFGKSS